MLRFFGSIRKIEILILVLLVLGLMLRESGIGQETEKPRKLNATVMTREEIQRVRPREVEKERFMRKHGTVFTHEDIQIVEDRANETEREPRRVIIRKYVPSVLFVGGGIMEGIRLSGGEVVQRRMQREMQGQVQGQVQEQMQVNQFVEKRMKLLCNPKKDYEVQAQSIVAGLNCLDIEKRRFIEVSGALIPQFKEFSLEFVANRVEGCEVIKEAYFRKVGESKTNVASFVDRKVIENILARATKRTALQGADALVMNLAEQARGERSVEIVDNVVRIREKERGIGSIVRELPYLAGINLIEAIAHEVLRENERMLPIFYVRGDELIEGEVVCLIKREGR